MFDWLPRPYLHSSILEEMQDMVQKLTQGVYDVRLRDLPSNDIGAVADKLNTLAETLQIRVQDLLTDKSHLETILSNMEEAVVAADAGGRVVFVNRALCGLFGLTREEAKGKLFLEVLRHSQLDKLLQEVLASAKVRMDEVTTFAPEECVFEAHCVPLMDESRCVGALLVLHNVTRLRRLEQIRRDFVANVSHELRTPLASIKGFAETLMSGGLEDSKVRMDFLRSIEKHADQMTAMVDDLLDLTAIESGQKIPLKEAISINDTIEDVAKSLNPLAKRKKVSFQFEIPADLPPVMADRNQVRQVLVNLVENAVKFNREGGTVRIEARHIQDSLKVSVTDSGPGIPSVDLPRIFERFYRVDKARSRSEGGTGLGLSIVKHIVEAHGGSVTVVSALGEGATFTFSLPL